jgi:hypothetical protein
MCDTLCVRHAAGMWFAKNSDRHPDEAQVVEWHPRRSAGRELHTQYLTLPDRDACAFVASRPVWLWGVEHGVNEHGVAAGNQKIWTTQNPRQLPRALLGMDVVRIVLERATSADDALEISTALIETYGQGGSGEPHENEPYFSSFLFADARAGWVLETSDRTWAARPADDGTSISNRVSLGTDWTRASADIAPGTDFDQYRLPHLSTSIADHRRAVAAACVANGPRTTFADITSTLRSHSDDGAGFTVCMHRRDMHSQTTASMITNIPDDGSAPNIWACLGNPCVGVYVPVTADRIPAELADERQWARFAMLRDRVEGGAETLERVREELDPVEAALTATSETYEIVHEALNRLGV